MTSWSRRTTARRAWHHQRPWTRTGAGRAARPATAFLLEVLSRAAGALCSPYHLERSAPAPPVLERRAWHAAASPRAAPRSARGRRTASTTAPCILRRGHGAGRPPPGRGGAAGGPSGGPSGVLGARRLGGGLSGCSAATGCCPFAAPSALRVVGAESSISLAITVGASAFANLEVAFHTSSL